VVTLACFTCYGSGEIDEAKAKAIEAGEQMRKERVARGLSLRAEARRLGIKPGVLADREQGRN